MIFRRLARALFGVPEPSLFLRIGVEIMPELRIGDRITLKAKPKLDTGEEAKVESYHWETSDNSVLEITNANPDGTAEFTALSQGDVEVSCEADADLGKEVKNIRAGFKITVKEPMATGLEIAVVSVAPPEIAPEIKKKPNLDR